MEHLIRRTADRRGHDRLDLSHRLDDGVPKPFAERAEHGHFEQLVKLWPVAPHAGKMDAPAEVQPTNQFLQRRSAWPVSHKYNVKIWPPWRQKGDCAQERYVVLDRAQIGHGSDDPGGRRYSQSTE